MHINILSLCVLFFIGTFCGAFVGAYLSVELEDSRAIKRMRRLLKEPGR